MIKLTREAMVAFREFSKIAIKNKRKCPRFAKIFLHMHRSSLVFYVTNSYYILRFGIYLDGKNFEDKNYEIEPYKDFVPGETVSIKHIGEDNIVFQNDVSEIKLGSGRNITINMRNIDSFFSSDKTMGMNTYNPKWVKEIITVFNTVYPNLPVGINTTSDKLILIDHDTNIDNELMAALIETKGNKC